MFDRSWEAAVRPRGAGAFAEPPAPEIKYPVFRAARDRFQSWTAQKLRPRSRSSYVVPRSEDIDLK
jgi:hypothetical protein